MIKRAAFFNLFLATLISGPALAQFEEEEQQEQQEQQTETPTETSGQVESGDIKALSEARANNSEAAMIKAASKILAIDQNNLLALNSLGVFYFEHGKWGLAQIVFNRGLQAHPNTPGLLNNLGIVYLAQGKQRQAVTTFRKALEARNDHRIAAANLGSILLQYHDYQRALTPLEAGYKATRSELKSGANEAVNVANNYALALAGTGKLDEAKDIFEEIVRGGGRQPLVLLNYAVLLVEKQKNYKEGSKLLSRIKFAVENEKVLRKVEELESEIRAGEK